MLGLRNLNLTTMKKNEFNSADNADQKLIEDHVYLEIEDKGAIPAAPAAGNAAAAVAEPVRKKSWGGWWAAAIVALLAIGCCIYFATRDSKDKEKQLAKTALSSGVISKSAGTELADATNLEDITVFGKYPMATESQVNQSAAKGKTVDYLYYFANDKSAVADNAVLNDVAEKAQATNADITITAYASPTGSAAYNANLCAQRAENLENYLVAHGVSADHIKIVNGGQTSQFGSDAYCRRADIVVNYAG